MDGNENSDSLEKKEIVEHHHVVHSGKSDEELMRERKEKFLKFVKSYQIWVILILLIGVILGVYIRVQPLLDHGGHPGLWDVTTNNWTLGPDLDPWLFLRTAKSVIETGTVPKIDVMRNVPLGFDNSGETILLPLMIDKIYHISTFFYKGTTPEFAGDIFPVIMFAFTIIAFFFFVRELFIRRSKKSKLKANVIASISMFIMIVMPAFLSRTVAGIPEKESAAFFFMFLAYYLLLKAWKSEDLKYAFAFAVFSGISTALMALIWGGVFYVYIPIGLTGLIAFILNKIHKKEFIVYSTWSFLALFVPTIYSTRYSLIGSLTSLSSGLAFMAFFVMCVHYLLWNTKLSENNLLKNIKLPRNITSLITSLILVVILVTVFFGFGFIVDKVAALHQNIFKPVIGRWNTTVAENRQPDFREWASSFGPYVRNIPIMFWLFFVGSVFLFYESLNKIKRKDSIVLTLFFVLLLMGMIFSRYSSSGSLNGESFMSKFIYYGAVFLFLGSLLYFYNKYWKSEGNGFEKIEFEYILILSLYIVTIFTVRGAVRLVLVLAPVASVFVGYLNWKAVESFFESKDDLMKTVWGIVALIIIISTIFTFWVYYQSVKSQAYGFIPSAYNQQWQYAMNWVRTSTPENAVFGHWWDYGYWVQSIGERATVLDGGNAITFWNYWMGRLVLTGDNQKEALDFLYAHNTTHFLIDSSDIGKYGAFSQIGSDENFDRLSYFGTMFNDDRRKEEKDNQTTYVFDIPAGAEQLSAIPVDEDLIVKENGTDIFLPSGNSGLRDMVVVIDKNTNEVVDAYGVYIYQGRQQRIDIKHVYVNGEFTTLEDGIEATIFIFPMISQDGQGVNINPLGTAMYISPRLMRGMLSQVYLMNDPLNNFPAFKLAHSEDSFVTKTIRAQGNNVPEFIYFQGLQGPIKIWEINYTGEEVFDEKYLDKDSSKYLSWKL